MAIHASTSRDVVDPWGNHLPVVDYRAVQFTNTAKVLRCMGSGSLEKSERALAELGERGLLG